MPRIQDACTFTMIYSNAICVSIVEPLEPKECILDDECSCQLDRRIRILTVLLSMLVSSTAQTAKPSSSPPYLDSTLPVNIRVDDLVSRMTLEEKASQLVNQAR